MKLLVAHGADPSLATEKLAAGGRFYQEATSKDSLGTAAGAGGRTEHLAVGRGVGRVLRVELHGIRAPVRADGHADGGSVPRGGAARRTSTSGTPKATPPLHNAAARGDNRMILYLVSKGADIKAVNRKGQTVADMANGPYQRIQPFPQTIALLQRLGARIEHKCVSC